MQKQVSLKRIALLAFIICTVFPVTFADSVNVTDFGVMGDGKVMNTLNIQKAIDYCSQTGGGEVIFPKGTYLIGTLELKNNVTLYVQHAAIIKGSTDINDYPYFDRLKALIYSYKAENVGIRGNGTVDGSGEPFLKGDNAPERPTLLLFDHCRNVRVQDVDLRNSAFWTFRMHKCDGVWVNRVNIYSHVNWNNDGFDIESKNVIISDCRVDTDDDALCFKSDDPDYVVENVTVTNCILSSNCNFIKFGTGSRGGFSNISISNCTLHKTSESGIRFWENLVWGVTQTHTGISGIALEVVDGGFMDQVSITNLTMKDVQTPVFIRLGKRNKDDRIGALKNVIISNIIATSQSYIANSITGVPGTNVENVIIRDCLFNMKGGGTKADAAKRVPEVIDSYPENRMFEQMLPAYGFFVRHARNITLDNVQLRYHSGGEERPAIVAEDVSGLQVRNSLWQKPNGNLKSLQVKECPGFIEKENIEL